MDQNIPWGENHENLPTGTFPFCVWAGEHAGRWKDWCLLFYCLVWTSSSTWTLLIFFPFTLPQCCLVAMSTGACIKERCSDFLRYLGFLGCPISYLQDFTLLNLSYLCRDLFTFILILTVLALASVSVDQMKPGKLLLPSVKVAFVMEVHPAKICPETPKPSNVGGLFQSSLQVMVRAVNWWTLTFRSKCYILNTKGRAGRNTGDILPIFIVVSIQLPTCRNPQIKLKHLETPLYRYCHFFSFPSFRWSFKSEIAASGRGPSLWLHQRQLHRCKAPGHSHYDKPSSDKSA